MKTFMFYAMGRSGSHAVINWICKNYQGNIIHRNNCIRGWDQKKFLPWSGVKKEYGAPPWDAQLLNIEWFDPDDYDKHRFWEFEPWQQGDVQQILLIRDPFNWLASSLKMRERNTKGKAYPFDKPFTDVMGIERPSGIDIYKKQAALARCSRFVRPLTINYNKWFSDMLYRDQVADELGIGKTDKGTQGVSRFGGGSSFDSYNLDGQTWKLGVLDRWKEMYQYPAYRALIDNELAEISSRMFDLCPFRPGSK